MDNKISEIFKSGVNTLMLVNSEDLKRCINELIEKAGLSTPKQELPLYYNPIQLSELLGLKLTTVYQNHHNGLIPGAKKVGGKLLFETKIILAWIEEKSILTHEEKVKALSNRRYK